MMDTSPCTGKNTKKCGSRKSAQLENAGPCKRFVNETNKQNKFPQHRFVKAIPIKTTTNLKPRMNSYAHIAAVRYSMLYMETMSENIDSREPSEHVSLPFSTDTDN